MSRWFVYILVGLAALLTLAAGFFAMSATGGGHGCLVGALAWFDVSLIIGGAITNVYLAIITAALYGLVYYFCSKTVRRAIGLMGVRAVGLVIGIATLFTRGTGRFELGPQLSILAAWFIVHVLILLIALRNRPSSRPRPAGDGTAQPAE